MSTFLITDGFGGDQYEYITGGLDSGQVAGFFITNGLGGSSSEYLLDGLAASGILAQSVTTCTTTSWTGFSLQEDQSPPVAVGDSFYADLVTTPGGYAVTIASDGTVTIDAGGDTTRQRFQADIFDVSAGAFYGSFSVYINNYAPQINVQPADVLILTNNAMSAINFTPTDPAAVNYIVDQDADPMAGAQISGSLPVGVTFAGNVLSGTPTSVVSSVVSFRFTDTVGDYVDCAINYVSDAGAVVPNIVGRTQGEAESDCAAVGLILDASVSVYSASVPVGNVVSQSISSGSRVFLGSSVAVVVSLGPIPVGGLVPNVVGMSQTDASTALSALAMVLVAIPAQSLQLAGLVIAQSPAAGTLGAGFSEVTVYISTGPAAAGDKTSIHVRPERGTIRIRR